MKRLPGNTKNRLFTRSWTSRVRLVHILGRNKITSSMSWDSVDLDSFLNKKIKAQKFKWTRSPRAAECVGTAGGRAANNSLWLHDAWTSLKIVRNSFHGNIFVVPLHIHVRGCTVSTNVETYTGEGVGGVKVDGVYVTYQKTIYRRKDFHCQVSSGVILDSENLSMIYCS